MSWKLPRRELLCLRVLWPNYSTASELRIPNEKFPISAFANENIHYWRKLHSGQLYQKYWAHHLRCSRYDLTAVSLKQCNTHCKTSIDHCYLSDEKQCFYWRFLKTFIVSESSKLLRYYHARCKKYRFIFSNLNVFGLIKKCICNY